MCDTDVSPHQASEQVFTCSEDSTLNVEPTLELHLFPSVSETFTAQAVVILYPISEADALKRTLMTQGYTPSLIFGACMDWNPNSIEILMLQLYFLSPVSLKSKVVAKLYLYQGIRLPNIQLICSDYVNIDSCVMHQPCEFVQVPIQGIPLSLPPDYSFLDHWACEINAARSIFLTDLSNLISVKTVVSPQGRINSDSSSPQPNSVSHQSNFPESDTIEPVVNSVVDGQPYELPDQRFQLIQPDSEPYPEVPLAKDILSQVGIDFSQSSEVQIQRGAHIVTQVQEHNPNAINPDLTNKERTQLYQLLFDFQDVCAFSFKDLPLPAKVEPFIINTGDAKPVAQRYFRLPAQIEEHLRTELKMNVDLGLQRNSASPWASPLFAVPKPHRKDVYRTVADFRGLNAVTIPDKYPLPLISQIFDEIGHSTVFHANDLLSGFWQIPMEHSSIPKTAVTTCWGLFEYTRLPQGVRNAPAHFMRVINKVLQDSNLTDSNAAFIDDLTSHGSDFQRAYVALRDMLSALRKVRLSISPLKMKWGYFTLSLLGHLISHGQIRCQPSKLLAIQALPPPKDVSQLRSFLGVVGYYRAFISHFASTATPLFALLKKDTEYVWTPACESAFQTLKNSLQSDPVLHVANSTGKFTLYTDWSCEAVSAILHQCDEKGEEHPIEFASKTCNSHERRYAPTEGELLAIIFGLSKYRSYLLGQQFTIVTDHSALQYLSTSRASPKLARWGLFLSEFNFEVRYRKGKMHLNADALSRLPSQPDESFQLDALLTTVDEVIIPQSVLQCSWYSLTQSVNIFSLRQELMESSPCSICGEDPEGNTPQVICDECNGIFHFSCIQMNKLPATYWFCQFCRAKYEQSQHYNILYDIEFQLYCLGSRKRDILLRESHFLQLISEGYGFSSGTLTRLIHGCVKQVPSPGRQILLLEESHVRNGHIGGSRLYDLLSIEYWWPSMRQDCANFVNHCLNCQLEKAVYSRESQLEHLPLPSAARAEWHIDLAPDLPSSDGVKQLIVCQDQYTKFILLGALSSRTSSSVREWFHSTVVAIFGVPSLVRTDQGSEFKGEFDQFCQDSRITHVTIPTESPWSNGVAERLVRTIKSYLKRLAVTEGELGWPKMLPNIQLGYNLAKHAALGVSPFELMFGGKGRFILEESSVPNLPIRPSPAQYVQHTQEVLKQVQQKVLLNRQQARAQSATQYAGVPLATSAERKVSKKKPVKQLVPGQLVAVSRHARTHLGVSSVGPFLVSKVEGAHVWVRSLTTGRERREHRVNIKPLALEFEALQESR